MRTHTGEKPFECRECNAVSWIRILIRIRKDPELLPEQDTDPDPDLELIEKSDPELIEKSDPDP
jgi:hypothetical protein